MFGDKVMNTYFHQAGLGRWNAILNMSGWTAKSEKYATHELAFNATNSVSDNNLYHRTGIGDTWQSWRTILDSYNFGGYAIPRVGEVISSLPSSYASMLFTVGSSAIHDKIAAWSKGVLITAGGGDAGLISVDSNNNLSWGFRNNGNWVGVRRLGENKVLWSGGHYMRETQEAYLSEPISDQVNGIVLVFSIYQNSTLGQTFTTAFVPKRFVASHAGNSSNFTMASSQYGMIGHKMLYISDTKILGHASNASNGTTNGVTFNNANFVLRYVYGV